jgi:predicted MarR family transcription regulator
LTADLSLSALKITLSVTYEVQQTLRGRVEAQDGRAVSVVLTRSGRRVALRIRQAREKSLTSALSALTSDEVDNLAAALDTMLTTVTLARAEERSAHSHDRPQP